MMPRRGVREVRERMWAVADWALTYWSVMGGLALFIEELCGE